MRISHRHKFVYIAIRKTGSESLRDMLDKYSDVFGGGKYMHNYPGHLIARKLLPEFEKNGWDWDDYYRFTVVRHPTARLYSCYKYMLRLGNEPVPPNATSSVVKFYQTCENLRKIGVSFNDAVLNNLLSGFFTRPQVDYILDANKESLLNKTVKLENLREELVDVWEHIGLPLEDLDNIPHINASPSLHTWQELLGKEAAQKIERMYAEDFELLNYK